MLAPAGTLQFIEHVRAEGALGKIQDLLTPAWMRLSAGCHLNRRTVEVAQAAGFAVETVAQQRLPGGIPLVAGIARGG